MSLGLQLGLGFGTIIAALVFIRTIYKWGYENGFKKGERRTLIEAAKNNVEIFKTLYHNIDNPNFMFKLREPDKRPKPN
jgi:hypothetical protein